MDDTIISHYTTVGCGLEQLRRSAGKKTEALLETIQQEGHIKNTSDIQVTMKDFNRFWQPGNDRTFQFVGCLQRDPMEEFCNIQSHVSFLLWLARLNPFFSAL